MSYDGGIRRHAMSVQVRYARAFTGIITRVGNSVRFGSPLTGAPGQPVRTGNLLLSWIDEIIGRFRWQMSTNVGYAKDVEDNVREVRFRNGGAHSVRLTVAGFDPIVTDALAEARGA